MKKLMFLLVASCFCVVMPGLAEAVIKAEVVTKSATCKCRYNAGENGSRVGCWLNNLANIRKNTGSSALAQKCVDKCAALDRNQKKCEGYTVKASCKYKTPYQGSLHHSNLQKISCE